MYDIPVMVTAASLLFTLLLLATFVTLAKWMVRRMLRQEEKAAAARGENGEGVASWAPNLLVRMGSKIYNRGSSAISNATAMPPVWEGQVGPDDNEMPDGPSPPQLLVSNSLTQVISRVRTLSGGSSSRAPSSSPFSGGVLASEASMTKGPERTASGHQLIVKLANTISSIKHKPSGLGGSHYEQYGSFSGSRLHDPMSRDNSTGRGLTPQPQSRRTSFSNQTQNPVGMSLRHPFASNAPAGEGVSLSAPLQHFNSNNNMLGTNNNSRVGVVTVEVAPES